MSSYLFRQIPEAGLQVAAQCFATKSSVPLVKDLLESEFDIRLKTKDIYNLKQSMTGSASGEWNETYELLEKLRRENPKSILQVLYSGAGEIQGGIIIV